MSRVGSPSRETSTQPPRWLLAELSYRCPLRCIYCSNPIEHEAIRHELTTDDWRRVLRQGRALGAVQLGLSGGEPLVRPDLEELVAEARGLGYYTNLITSGIGLTEGRLARLVAVGLDHIQLSLQAATPSLNDEIGGARTFERKLTAARRIKESGLPMVLNVVLHRRNIDEVPRILELADELGADYVELANAQYDGWAFRNRAALLPTAAQLTRAEAAVAHYRATSGRARVFFVVPDYFAGRPKPCGGGWAAHLLLVAPDGLALPCHGARKLPLAFPNVRETGLREIWEESPAFQRFRGDEWMAEPCRSCPERAQDFGGCRCQAYLLTGDPTATDPACRKAPRHDLIRQAVADTQDEAPPPPLRYRDGAPAAY